MFFFTNTKYEAKNKHKYFVFTSSKWILDDQENNNFEIFFIVRAN